MENLKRKKQELAKAIEHLERQEQECEKGLQTLNVRFNTFSRHFDRFSANVDDIAAQMEAARRELAHSTANTNVLGQTIRKRMWISLVVRKQSIPNLDQ